jgi:hypothetical protein
MEEVIANTKHEAQNIEGVTKSLLPWYVLAVIVVIVPFGIKTGDYYYDILSNTLSTVNLAAKFSGNTRSLMEHLGLFHYYSVSRLLEPYSKTIKVLAISWLNP